MKCETCVYQTKCRQNPEICNSYESLEDYKKRHNIREYYNEM